MTSVWDTSSGIRSGGASSGLTTILPDLLMPIYVCQGFVWLLLATIAGVPSTVRLTILLHSFFTLIAIYSAGVYGFESEW
jgi:hypothetical protein